jgi:single-strand DNA-binding protein
MASVNVAILLGNVGKDPETKTFEGGQVTKFSLATNKSWVKDGEKKEVTTWHDVSAFGKLGEIVSKYVKRGSQIYVSGEIRVDSWENEAGEKKYRTYIVADEVQFLGARSDSPAPELGAQASERSAQKSVPPPSKVHNYAPGADNSHLSKSAEEPPF